MKKVYADPKLPYSQDTKFEFPDNLDLCSGGYESEYYYEAVEEQPTEEKVEGIFE